MALFGRKNAQERIADALEHLAKLYSLDLSARGIFQEVGTDEGEVLYDDRTPEDEFEREVAARDYEDDEQRRAHLDYLRELEREALRLFTPSGFVPGTGPEGAEDPASPPEDNGSRGERSARPPERSGGSAEQEG